VTSLHPPRRRLLQGMLLGLAGAGLCVTQVHAADHPLPSTTSLPEALAKALQGKQPLVVMVSLQGCPFCKVVRESYLRPLFEAGLPVVQIDMREARTLVDADGSTVSQDVWIKKRGIKLAPTVLFLGAQGREVADRLKGAYLPDFYGAYLDEQLTVARRAMQSST